MRKNTPPAIPPASAKCIKCNVAYTSDSIGSTCPLTDNGDGMDRCDGAIVASDENTSRAPHAFDVYSNDKGMWRVYNAHDSKAPAFAWVFPWNMKPHYN